MSNMQVECFIINRLEGCYKKLYICIVHTHNIYTHCIYLSILCLFITDHESLNGYRQLFNNGDF